MTEIFPSHGTVLRGYFLRSSSGLQIGKNNVREVTYEEALREIGASLSMSVEFSIYGSEKTTDSGKKYTTIKLESSNDTLMFEFESHGR
jgi:hypothetical protein